MTHKTNLYAGWWLYLGLIGLGVALFLFGYGGTFGWLGLAVVSLMGVAAAAAYLSGRGPTAAATTVLSAQGVTMTHTPHGDAAIDLIPWEEITAVRVLPQPGYWETELQTSLEPDAWLPMGRGLELAEEIAEVAGLIYREDLNTSANMGVEHYWTKSDA